MKEISWHILDIARNSLDAGADEVILNISENDQSDELVVEIIDNGNGIGKDMLEIIDDPFTTSRKNRRVGLGIPLLKQHATSAGGKFEIGSREGKGTRVKAFFQMSHIDRQPLGDIPGVIRILFGSEELVNFSFNYTSPRGEFTISTDEIKEILEVSDLMDTKLLCQIEDLIRTNLTELGSESCN